MKKLTQLSFACTTIFLLSACGGGGSSGSAAAAQGTAACQANAACATALAQAQQVPLNQPANSATSQVPAAIGSTGVTLAGISNVNVASSAGTSTTTASTGSTATSQVARQSSQLDAAKILDDNNGINYENAVSAFNKAVASGNNSVSNMATDYSTAGAAGAK